MAKIVVVDDEPALASTITYNLRRDGHDVFAAGDGQLGLDLVLREAPDLLLLDLMLPKRDGLDICRAIRQSSNAAVRSVPIIMLTARTDEVDRVVGLEVGADDYVTKPFSMRELMARVKALLRRSHMHDADVEPPQPVLTVGDLQLDGKQRLATRKHKELALKPREFDLLAFLMQHAGQVFTREQLLEHVWGPDFVGDSRTVDVHVRWLREKIEKRPSKPKILETVRGVGYRVRASKDDDKPDADDPADA